MLIKNPQHKNLQKSVAGHTDLVIHPIEGKKIVVAPDIERDFRQNLVQNGFTILDGKNILSEKYPNDISYNVARVGEFAFHNTKYTDEVIVREYDKLGIKFLHVNQGYTKCSIAVVDDKSIITSDVKIAETAEKNNIEALLIEQEKEILLPGLEHGFFGGSVFMLKEKTMAICGNKECLKRKSDIEKFLEKRDIKLISLSNEGIIDFGSPFVF